MSPRISMSHRVEIRPATEVDALVLKMREPDVREALAYADRDPNETLADSVRNSHEAWTGLADGEIVCLFGVAPLSLTGVTGIPWMSASDAIVDHQRAFLRRNRPFIDRWSAEFPVMRNFVDVRNETSIRWLKWLGFTIGPIFPYGASGLPFHLFEKRAN